MADVERDMGQGLFSMFKGEPGTRKSTCALSYPTPQYWVSTDRKMQALSLPRKRWGIKDTDIQYDDYRDWDTPKKRLQGFQTNCPFRTIIVDSLTSIGDNINRQTIKLKSAEGMGKKVGSIYVPGLEEYNAEASAFQDMIDILKDIHEYHKCHVILIAHVVGQRQDQDKNKLTHHSRVIITGGDKISGKIASYMVEAYHFNVETDFNVDSGEGKFGLFTQHVGNDYARTSLPLERKVMFNNDPLYEKWIEPAIKKLRAEQPIQKIQSQTPTPHTTPTTNAPSFTPQTKQP